MPHLPLWYTLLSFWQIKFCLSVNEELLPIAFCVKKTFPLSPHPLCQILHATKGIIQCNCVLNNVNSKASFISSMSWNQEIDVFKCAFIKWLDFPKENVCHLSSSIVKGKYQNIQTLRFVGANNFLPTNVEKNAWNTSKLTLKWNSFSF